MRLSIHYHRDPFCHSLLHVTTLSGGLSRVDCDGGGANNAGVACSSC